MNSQFVHLKEAQVFFFWLRRANAPKRSSLFFFKKKQGPVYYCCNEPSHSHQLGCLAMDFIMSARLHRSYSAMDPSPPSTKSAQRTGKKKYSDSIRFVDLQRLHCTGYRHPRHLLEETSN